jgi:hypothetical protein
MHKFELVQECLIVGTKVCFSGIDVLKCGHVSVKNAEGSRKFPQSFVQVQSGVGNNVGCTVTSKGIFRCLVPP